MRKRGYFIYKYYIRNQLVYVGKTSTTPYQRYKEHLAEKDGQYELVDRVDIYECETKADMDVLELMLIANYKPEWNTAGIAPDELTLPVPDISFFSYTIDDFLKAGQNKKKREKEMLKESDLPPIKSSEKIKRYFMVDGKRHWLRCDPRLDIDAQVEAARNEFLRIRKKKEAMTARMWVDEYMRLFHGNDEQQTIDALYSMLDSRFFPVVGASQMRHIKPSAIAEIYDELKDSPHDYNKQLKALIDDIFAKAADEGIIDEKTAWLIHSFKTPLFAHAPVAPMPLSKETLEKCRKLYDGETSR